ncbi:hypothetical protein KAH43_05240 [Candidatus Bipolaricaulota bacterium]|nr:hypothetical protein [Candidatus Bipolaricaulota bacterium]
MKKTGIVLCLLLLTGVASWALSVCDYKSPETSLTDARLSFSYRYYDDANTIGTDVNSGRFAADYDQMYDSPSYGFTISGSAELALDAFMPTGWLGQSAATFRYYPFEKSLFFAFGGLQASMATAQLQPGVEVRFGGGVGRFSNVTPLAKAMNMSKDLRRSGAIGNPLTDGVLLAIAGIIGREIEYDTVKELVADIEPLIEADAAVELDARALLTVEEIVLTVGDDSQCGWALQLGIGYELVDPFGNPQNIVVAGSADAAFAFGPDDQMMFHASYSGPFDLMDENTLTSTLSYEYALTEDSTVIADYVLQRVKPSGVVASTSHAAGLAVGFDLGGADILLQISLTRGDGDPGWSFDLSVSAAMDLL